MKEELHSVCAVKPIRLAKVAVLAIACFGVGVFVGTRISTLPTSMGENSADSSAGYEAARAKLIKNGFMQDPATLPPFTGFTAKVQSVESSSLSVLQGPLDPLDDPSKVTVRIAPDTEVVRLDAKDPAQYQEEVQAYNDALAERSGEDDASGSAPTYPLSAVRTPIALTDIPVGATVNVQLPDSVARESVTVTARSIEVVAAPATNPEPAPASPAPEADGASAGGAGE